MTDHNTPNHPADVSQDALRADMTLAEKASLVSGEDFWKTAALPEHGVGSAVLSDGPHGVRYQDENADHLGLNHSVPATAYPTASATACSWDRSLLQDIGVQLGKEARAIGVDVLLGPGMNIKRSPLCGRNFEYFSEDPLLTGELAIAWVNGLQSQSVGASVKHFAANNQETDRMRVDVNIDERTLREIYLRGFERVITQSQPATVMASYNVINGTKVAENQWLLNDVLRQEWGYQGVVVSDWGAVSDPVSSLRAGLDLEMPGTSGVSASKIVAAVESGALSQAHLDRSVQRVTDMVNRYASGKESQELDVESGHSLAYRAAVESAVLLSNDGVLPLSSEEGGTVAVIGEFARHPRYQGAGSSHVVPTRIDAALDAIEDRLQGRRTVTFTAGFTLDDSDDHQLADEAVANARDADVVLLFLGLPDEDESEGFDREHMLLPPRQVELLHRIAEVSDRVVVVLSHGSVVDTASWSADTSAVLDMWLAGQASGSAAAALLFGDENPSGKLAETMPVRIEDTPAFLNWPGTNHEVTYGERIYVGYRFYDTKDVPVAHPFGHGLSYTAFEYGALDIATEGDQLTLTVPVRNVGERAGAEIVQFYAGAPGADRPTRELIGFAKVPLGAGETASVTVHVPLRDLAFFSTAERRWVRSAGSYRVWAAASSRDLRAYRDIELDGTEAAPWLDLDSSLGEWLINPTAEAALQALFAEIAEPGAITFDEATLPVVTPIPLGTLLNMMLGGRGIRVSEDQMADLVRKGNTQA